MVSEMDVKVRALYYLYLIGGPWKFAPMTDDPEAWNYLREVSDIVYDGIGDMGVDDFMVHMDGEQIVNIIVKDLTCQK